MFELDLREENLARFPIHRLKHILGAAFFAYNEAFLILLFVVDAFFTKKARARFTFDNWHSGNAMAHGATEEVK